MEHFNERIKLNNGALNPCLGFGTYKAAEGKGAEVIKMAMDAGYRYFDTASFYETEAYLSLAMKEAKIPREELFITSKAWKTQMGYKAVKDAFAESLKKLETDYLDMYLIHWPVPDSNGENWRELDIESWKAMEELYESGRIKAIGVSNFLPHHLENLVENCSIVPAVNQIEFHPGYTQELTVQYCKEKNILIQAWSPIGRSALLSHPVLQKMGEKYKVSVAQICIRYAIQRGIVPLPKSSSLERMKQNQEVFHFVISKEDMFILGTLPQTGWSGLHPDGTDSRQPKK